jgi:hypothetical protein
MTLCSTGSGSGFGVYCNSGLGAGQPLPEPGSAAWRDAMKAIIHAYDYAPIGARAFPCGRGVCVLLLVISSRRQVL